MILDALVPDTLPLGARGVGPFAPCAVCLALDPGTETVRLPTIDDVGGASGWLVLRGARRLGTHLYYGTTPICRPHARRIQGATWGPRAGARWAADLAACVAYIQAAST